ncbi:molecular chaperone Hsp33 [Alteromonadaceae bacterium 2753L.S.0a.02]|nr:molecular chaperone Hsp33 [Alteromonadaceae bacterium 2753L.S.0a.02]
MNDLMSDNTHRFLFENTDIRGNLATLSESFQKIASHQKIPHSALPILGEFVAAVALLSETLKFDGILTLQVRGDGPLPLIVAECSNQGHLRAVAKAAENISQETPLEGLTLPQLMGNGVLTITIDPVQGQRYQGIVPVEGDTLADCLGYYFAQSEQLPTRLWLCASETQCAGLMLQSLPAQQVSDPELREEQWRMAEQLAATVSAEELLSLDHETVLYRLFHEMLCRIFPARNFEFKCSCTRERSENAIASLGKQEALALLEEQGKIGIDCHFCGQHYAFKSADIEQMFKHGEMH